MTRVLTTRSLRYSRAIPEAALLLEDASILAAPMLSASRSSPILETSASHKTTSATDHPWSSPSITLWQQIIFDLRFQLRSLIFLHVHNVKRPPVWAVMNRGGFLCKQSQQLRTNYYGRYNKSTRTDHAIMRIMLVPSVPHAHRSD